MTYLIERGGARDGAAPPAAPAAAAERARRAARGAPAARAARHARARARRCSPCATTRRRSAAPFYVMERIEGEVIVVERPRTRWTRPRSGARIGERADRRARRDPRGRLAGGRASRASASRPATWSASCGASAACGSSTRRARSPPVERVGGWLAEHLPELRPGHDRARRLPPRQHDLRAPTRPPRLEAVLDWEMATIGDPLADLGYLCMMWTERGDPEGGMREHARRRHAPRGLPHARRADRALRGALGALDERHPLVHDARAVEVDRVHGGQLQARDRRHDRRSRT